MEAEGGTFTGSGGEPQVAAVVEHGLAGERQAGARPSLLPAVTNGWNRDDSPPLR